MSTKSQLLHVRLMRKLLSTFATNRINSLNRRGRQNFIEVMDTLGEYFDEHGVEGVDLRRDAVDHPRKRLVSLTRVLNLLEDFEEDCLIRELDAEPEFIRRAEHIVRDLTRWLRGQAIKNPRTAA